MRYSALTLAAILGVSLVVASVAPAEARRARGPQTVHHYGYYPRYNNVYEYDRYAYRYEPRRYYPYYNSAYWRPAAEIRYRQACCRPFAPLPPYYQAWGYPYDYYPNSYVVRGGIYWHYRR